LFPFKVLREHRGFSRGGVFRRRSPLKPRFEREVASSVPHPRIDTRSVRGRETASHKPTSLGRTRRPMRCRPRPVAVESALWFIAPPRRAMLRYRRGGRRSALSRTFPCGIAVDAAPRSERSRHEDARARGWCSLRSESLRSLNLTFTSPCDRWRRTTGWLPSLSGAEVRGASLCATLVAEPSLEFASSLHPEVLAACLFRDRGPSLGFVT